MTDEFLAFSKARGNDLSTPNEMYEFPGLKAETGGACVSCAGKKPSNPIWLRASTWRPRTCRFSSSSTGRLAAIRSGVARSTHLSVRDFSVRPTFEARLISRPFFKRRVVRLLLLAVVTLALLIGFLPTVLGSKWIYQPLIDQLSADQFHLSIDKVRLRWFSPLRFDGIKLSEGSGPPLITIRQVRTDRSLFGYLIGGRRLGRLEIDEPTVSVELLKDGSNLERLVQAIDQAAKRPETQTCATPFDIDVAIITCRLRSCNPVAASRWWSCHRLICGQVTMRPQVIRS